MDEVQTRRETVVIIRQGKPVPKLVPAGEEADEICNFLRGGDEIADILAPAIVQNSSAKMQTLEHIAGVK
jgi:antitoxin (DNA-binding transcriptional repressor) of toxin-antitoxin stability system